MKEIHMKSTRKNNDPTASFETDDGILVSIIVTHFNYSEFIKNALLSVVQQSHHNFECIIVDDKSQPEHLEKLSSIVAELADPRLKIIALAENAGQTNALFEGLRKCTGEFVALLDPDDIYAQHFLKKMLACHLNSCVYAAVASCEMGLFRIGGPKLTSSYVGFKFTALSAGTLPRMEAMLSDFGFSTYYPPETTGWLWGTTSAMMFRRDALELLRRETYMPGTKVHADTYCVLGAHMLGGTLFVDEILSWRGLHSDNVAESPWVISHKQFRHRPTFVDLTKEIRRLAMETLLSSGHAEQLRVEILAQTLTSHFKRDVVDELLASYPQYAELRENLRPSLWKRLKGKFNQKQLKASRV